MVKVETKQEVVTKYKVGDTVLINIKDVYGWAQELNTKFVGKVIRIQNKSAYVESRPAPMYEIGTSALDSLDGLETIMVYEDEIIELTDLGRAIFE